MARSFVVVECRLANQGCDRSPTYCRLISGGFVPLFLSTLFAIILFLWAGIIALAQDSPCDPGLNQTIGDPNGYRLRGDRCEGIYIKEVAGSSTLVVVSMTESFEQYDATSGKSLYVEWPALGNERVWLRAYSLRRKLYYRMDAFRPPGSARYMWPSGTLDALGIEKKDLGIVGWTPYTVGNAKRDVYLPLRITQQDGLIGGFKNYKVLLLSSVELEKVFISLVSLDFNGRPDTFIRRDEELGYGYYPPDRPIDISISGMRKPGIYHLEIGATLRTGGSAATELWFYHSGK